MHPKYLKAIEDIKEGASYLDDDNYCTVSTLALTTEMSYLEAYAFMRDHVGRKHGSGIDFSDLIKMKEELEATGKYKITKTPYTGNNRITISRFCKEHPKGKFYVVVRNHALTIIDGVHIDIFDKPRRLIKWGIQVEKI